MPTSCESIALRSSTSGNSTMKVAFQLLPSGISGLYASSSSLIPSASKIFSIRSISWIWYCIVRRSSKYSAAFVPRLRRRFFLCSSTFSRKAGRASAYCSRL